jgi:hypothetical protein
MLDPETVKTLCDTVGKLIVPLASHAALQPAERKPADDALIRQLSVAGGALHDALNTVARFTPMMMPPMPPPPVPSTSTGS